jgi:uncharacterized OB-fold protein
MSKTKKEPKLRKNREGGTTWGWEQRFINGTLMVVRCGKCESSFSVLRPDCSGNMVLSVPTYNTRMYCPVCGKEVK